MTGPGRADETRVVLWWGYWDCHCSTITEHPDDVPTVCPEHGTRLMGPVDPVTDPAPGTVLGYEPSDMCGCPDHAGGSL